MGPIQEFHHKVHSPVIEKEKKIVQQVTPEDEMPQKLLMQNSRTLSKKCEENHHKHIHMDIDDDSTATILMRNGAMQAMMTSGPD